MPEHLRTTVGVFSSAGGRWVTDKAPNVRSVEPAPDLPAAQRGDLYILVEMVAGRVPDRLLYRQMLDAAQSAFYSMGDSVDVAMRQAVRSVHVLLRHINDADKNAGLRAGMTLAMRLGRHVVVAQAGPSVAVISHADGIDQYPDRPARWTPPLGGSESGDIAATAAINQTTIEPGSILILGHSGWLQWVKPETLAVASMAADVNLATQYLSQMVGTHELSALLVGFDLDIPAVRPDDQRLTPRMPVEPPPSPRETPTEPDRPRGGFFGGRKLFGIGRGAEEEAAPEGNGTVTSGLHDLGAPPPVSPATRFPGETTDPNRGERAPAEEMPPPPPPVAPVIPPQRRERNDWPLPRPAEPPVAPPVAVYAPEPEATYEEYNPPAPAEQPRRRSAWPLVLALVVLPLLIVGVVVSMLLVRTRAAEAQFAEKISGAQNAIMQAETLTDSNAASEKLLEARDFLDAARTIRSTDARLNEQQTRYEAVLNRVEHVSPLYGIVPLWDFKSEGRKLSRVIASGDSVFVLDRGRNEVQRFIRSSLGDSVTPANANATPLLARGAALGEKTVGDLVDMAWGPAATANQRSLLLTLDATRNLVGYDAVYGVKMLPLGGTAKLGQPHLIAGYGGNLYMADLGANQIWRYRPQGDGYESEPEPYFKNPNNLTGLQSLAIDGHIWLLFNDGRVLKFLSGEQPQFALQGLPNNFSNPVTLAVPQEGNLFYVADPGNARIVELTKDGQFVRQFKAREGDILKNMVDLYLDEAGSMFYILTPDQLFKAYVPDEAQTPAATPTNTPTS